MKKKTSANGRRGQPLKPPEARRDRRLVVHLTANEHDAVMAMWDKAVYPSRSGYLRARLCEREIRVRTWDQNLEAGLDRLHNHNELLRRIGVNLNQLIRHMNEHKSSAGSEEVVRLAEVVGACARAQEASQRDLRVIAERYANS